MNFDPKNSPKRPLTCTRPPSIPHDSLPPITIMKTALHYLLASPVRMVAMGMAVLSACLIGYSIYRMFIYQPPAPVYVTRCTARSFEKIMADSLFLPVEARGRVVDTDAGFKTHSHLIYIDVELIEADRPALKDLKIPFVKFISPKTLRIGVWERVNQRVQVGDRFEKCSGAYAFLLEKRPGDSIITELDFSGACPGKNCLFERKGDTLCYLGFGGE